LALRPDNEMAGLTDRDGQHQRLARTLVEKSDGDAGPLGGSKRLGGLPD